MVKQFMIWSCDLCSAIINVHQWNWAVTFDLHPYCKCLCCLIGSVTEHATLCKWCCLSRRLPVAGQKKKRKTKDGPSQPPILTPLSICGRAPLLLLEKYNNSDKTVITTVICLGRPRPVWLDSELFFYFGPFAHACSGEDVLLGFSHIATRSALTIRVYLNL